MGVRQEYLKTSLPHQQQTTMIHPPVSRIKVKSMVHQSEHSPYYNIKGTAISPTGGVFSYLPHHLDLASEDSVGHSTCMCVLARRRAIMGSIVQPKRSCLGAATGTAESPHR